MSSNERYYPYRRFPIIRPEGDDKDEQYDYNKKIIDRLMYRYYLSEPMPNVEPTYNILTVFCVYFLAARHIAYRHDVQTPRHTLIDAHLTYPQPMEIDTDDFLERFFSQARTQMP